MLGPLVVKRLGTLVAMPAGRARNLFGFLLVHGGSVHSVEMLTDVLWDGHPPRTAPTALHGFVCRLRKVLGAEVLLTAEGGYRLALEPEQTDSGRFAALTGLAQTSRDGARRSALLRQALTLWRGPALDTFRFEPFAQAEIAALEELRLCAVEEAIEADLALGRHGLAVPELQQLVQRHPLRERFWAQLMLALYRAERQADALAAYRQARSWMAEELGIEPGPQLRWLEQSILRQDAGLMSELPAGTGMRSVTKVDDVEASFAGRGGDLGRLAESVTEVTAEPGFVELVGPGEAASPGAPASPALRASLARQIRGLAPGEWAVLEGAAVAGHQFTTEAVRALVPEEARSNVERHLRNLSSQRLVQRVGDGYEFLHPLIHQAAYAACDPAVRAPLHEAYAHWLAAQANSADELIGYHFEQARGNLLTLRSPDAQARKLGALAAVHLGGAGTRAFRRADMTSAADLLTRAAKLLEPEDPQRLALQLAAARPLRTLGRMTEAVSVLLEVIDRAARVGDVSSEWRARLELAFLRAVASPGGHLGQDAFLVADKAISVLEPLGGDEGLVVAWALIAAHHEQQGRLVKAATAYENAGRHALRLPASPYDGIVAEGFADVLADGPTPVAEAIGGCERLLGYRDHPQHGVMLALAMLHSMAGDTTAAQRRLDAAQAEIHRRGVQRPLLFLARDRARIALLAGDPAEAERHARHGLMVGSRLGGDEADELNAMLLAQALSRQDRLSEAEQVASAYSGGSTYDIIRTAGWDVVRSEIRASRQAWAEARELATNAYTLVAETDFVNVQAEAALTLARACHGAGDLAVAVRYAEIARELFAAKGNVVMLNLAQAAGKLPGRLLRHSV